MAILSAVGSGSPKWRRCSSGAPLRVRRMSLIWVRSSRKWPDSGKSSRFRGYRSLGTDWQRHVHRQRPRPGQSPEARRAPGDWLNAVDKRRRAQAAMVPNDIVLQQRWQADGWQLAVCAGGDLRGCAVLSEAVALKCGLASPHPPAHCAAVPALTVALSDQAA